MGGICIFFFAICDLRRNRLSTHPMEKDFWINRWQSDDIPFHKGTVNPHLEKHFEVLEWNRGEHVLVPLCGKSLDMLWLEQKGLKVTGVEWSEKAVRAFLTENGRKFEQTQRGDFQYFKSQEINLYQGDFFQMTPEVLGAIDAVYDRASLIALDAERRKRYVRKITQLAGGKAMIFLLTLEYDPSCMCGPPFSVDPENVRALYGNDFHITLLETLSQGKDTLRPSFVEKGIEWMIDRAYLLKPL